MTRSCLQGDVVLVPPVGSTVAVDGQVQRPAIYELRNETMPAEVDRPGGRPHSGCRYLEGHGHANPAER